jgi:disulfide bond formation protein DsbB
VVTHTVGEIDDCPLCWDERIGRLTLCLLVAGQNLQRVEKLRAVGAIA